mgnify:CR=1 FL=1
MPNQDNVYRLSQVPIGSLARVISIAVDGLMRHRLLDLGLVPNTLVKVKRSSPYGDPTAYEFRGSVIALRSEESRLIRVHQ